jgi:hypothetical protein
MTHPMLLMWSFIFYFDSIVSVVKEDIMGVDKRAKEEMEHVSSSFFPA